MTPVPTEKLRATPAAGSAIYVDTENLRDPDHAQNIVSQIVAGWSGDFPPLSSLSLYVRADKAASWEMWAETSYPQLRLRVRGVQHFSNHRAKNSADLAITADAIADLVTGHATFVGVVSNDSDFGALFVKVKELARSVGVDKTPFLWITSPEAGGLSPEMDRFIPEGLRWDLSEASPALVVTPPKLSQSDLRELPEPERPAALAPAPQPEPQSSRNEAIAQELIRQLPVGRFKVADAQQVVIARWPKQPNVNHPAKFGQYLLNEIWPILQGLGVLMPRATSPRTYEITQAAKDFISELPPAQSSRDDSTPPERTLPQLAVAVANGLPDDQFKASDAQDALKKLQPQHPAASYTAAQFGTWFARQLWPEMEKYGVVLANDKPRRYEMTPDARARLTSLS